MPGWFHVLPPQPPRLPASIAPEDTAAGNSNVYVGTIPQASVTIRSMWGPESWNAQRGATVASQLATAWPKQAPPPFVHTVLRYARLAWTSERWDAQVSGGAGSITAATVVITQVPATSVATSALIRANWLEPQWDPQAESTIASIFATPANAVVSPAPPLAVQQANITSTWPKEDWGGQSESALAGGLAPIQAPPVFVPSQAIFATLLAGGQLWPRETWSAQSAPHTTAWLPPPVTAVPAPTPHLELLLWPLESWAAQRAAVVAGSLSLLSQQIPPPPVGKLAQLVASWPREDWPVQSGTKIAGPLAPVVPPVFVPKSPIQSSLFNELIASWPQAAWKAQTGARTSQQFAQNPVAVFTSVAAAQAVQYLWPQESWQAQSSAPAAAQLASLQVPPLYTPVSRVGALLTAVRTWPQDSWSAQTAPAGANWIQLLAPVAAQPAQTSHTERFNWPREQWSAQQGPKTAPLFATALQPKPTPPVQQKIVSTWAPESWNSQSAATVASGLALVFDVPFVPTAAELSDVLSWPQEQWKAQRGATIASRLSSVPVPAPAVPSAALETIRFTWPEEAWTHQRGSRNAASFAPAPIPVPFIPVPQRFQLISSWPQESWGAQSASQLAFLGAFVGPPPPPPPPVRVPHPTANLGYKVTTRTFNLLEMTAKAWGGEFRQPDHRVYEFSNGRSFDSTDQGTTGIYRKK